MLDEKYIAYQFNYVKDLMAKTSVIFYDYIPEYKRKKKVILKIGNKDKHIKKIHIWNAL